MPKCSRCWSIIGESYRCLDHGGEPGFSDAVKRWKRPPADPMPPAALNDLHHEWWAFLDRNPPNVKRRAKQTLFDEVIP